MITRPMPPLSTLRTLCDLLNYRCEAHPDRVAYTFLGFDNDSTTEQSLAYQDLWRGAHGVAALLLERRVQGAPVLLGYEPGLDFLTAFWGCVLSGNIAVPIYAPRGEWRLRGLNNILADCGATVGLTHWAYLSHLQRGGGGGAPNLQQLLWLRTDVALPTASTGALPRPHRLAVLQYTSGSTGTPKGVQIKHDNVLANEASIQQAFGHDADTVVVNCLPHHHDMGLFGNLLQPLYVGGRCVSMSPAAFIQRPARWLEAIARYRATTSGGPGFMYDLCSVKAANLDESVSLETWSIAFIGAEPVRSSTMERFSTIFGDRGFASDSFRPCYGLAEATLLVSMATAPPGRRPMEPTEAAATHRVSCGVTHGEQSFLIVDPKTREPQRSGIEGEIWVRGRNVAAGYWYNAAATRDTFDAFTFDGIGPFLRTGDMGYELEGELFVSGRLGAFLIIDGEHYHAEDIETHCERLGSMLGMGRCAAIPDREGPREEFILLVEVMRTTARSLDPASAGDTLACALARAMGIVPRAIIFVRQGSMPHTPSGKTQRHSALQQLHNGELSQLAQWRAKADYAPVGIPHTTDAVSLSDWLMNLIACRKGLELPQQVSVSAPFATLGLDSKDLLELADRLSVHLSREIDPMLMWECPSIEELVQRLNEPTHDAATLQDAPC